jgi:hypothetical protein
VAPAILVCRAEDVFRAPFVNPEGSGFHVIEKSKFCQRCTDIIRIVGIPECEDAVIVEIWGPGLQPSRRPAVACRGLGKLSEPGRRPHRAGFTFARSVNDQIVSQITPAFDAPIPESSASHSDGGRGAGGDAVPIPAWVLHHPEPNRDSR